MALRTDYTNDILDSSKNTERVYNIKNASGEIVNAGIKIEDITQYAQEGSKFGANDINATNQAVNNINVYVGEDKKLHFVNGEGADSVLPFSSGIKIPTQNNNLSTASNYTFTEDYFSVFVALWCNSGTLPSITYNGSGIQCNQYANGGSGRSTASLMIANVKAGDSVSITGTSIGSISIQGIK